MLAGIDLGTYFSEIAVRDGEKAECVLNKDGTKLTHSVVSFPSEKETMVGNIAWECQILYPEVTVKEVKRKMGQKTAITVRGVSYTPPQISSMILKALKDDVESSFDEPVTSAVITVPVAFGSRERQATLEAAALAGLARKDVMLVEEPVAALLPNLHLSECKNGEIILVIDIGGGTSDICGMRVTKDTDGKLILNAICLEGDAHLGGADIDKAIAEYIHKKEFAGVTLTVEEESELFVKTEAAKRELSQKEETELKVMVAARRKKIHITRKELEQAATAEFCKLGQLLEKVEKELKEKNAKPARVILCGGSTRIPKVEEMVRTIFKTAMISGENRSMSVAEGAVLYGELCQKNEQPVFRSGRGEKEIEEKTESRRQLPVKRVNLISSKSYGIAAITNMEQNEEKVCNMILKNEPIPLFREEKRRFVTRYENTGQCKFRVYESSETGKYLDLNEAKEIGTCILKVKGDLPARWPLTVSFLVEQDGILYIKACEETYHTEVTAEFVAELGIYGE